MFVSSLLFMLITFFDIIAPKNISIMKLPCNVKSTEITPPAKMIPAEITPENFQQLIKSLKYCHITKAQVAGWNGEKGSFILHDNGTVVPAETLTLPNVGLYFDVCGCAPFQILCVTDFSNPEKMRCYAPCGVKVESVNCEKSPTFPEANTPALCESQDKFPTFAKQTRRCKKYPCSENELDKICSRRLIFECDEKKQPILRVITKVTTKCTQNVNLDDSRCKITPSTLSDRDTLYKIIQLLMKENTCPVGLFVSNNNRLYARIMSTASGVFYTICYKNDTITLKIVPDNKLASIVSRGLFRVTFKD